MIYQVNIDVLKRKNVYLLISTLDITDEDISVLKPVHDHIKKDDQYKIVWIPIVEKWNDDLKKKFELLKAKMPWYIVHHFGMVAGFKYIKEVWHFKKQPMIVVLNHQGKVQQTDAFHWIKVYGLKAFPFTSDVVITISRDINWVGSVVGGIDSSLDGWVSIFYK